MDYADKYNLSREQSMFLAKKKWVEVVYCGMKMENRSVNFPQIQTILGGGNISESPGITLDDVQAILNLRDAWTNMVDNIDAEINVELMCEINSHIARNNTLTWGRLRSGTVGISGTDYLPPVPVEEQASRELAQILAQGTTATETSLDIFVWCSRGQFFWDGNKRTGMILANKIMISGGYGVLIIPDKHMEEFNTLLLDFYGSGNSEKLKYFLYDTSIQGIDF